MARTRHRARKSTGGCAPRKPNVTYFLNSIIPVDYRCRKHSFFDVDVLCDRWALKSFVTETSTWSKEKRFVEVECVPLSATTGFELLHLRPLFLVCTLLGGIMRDGRYSEVIEMDHVQALIMLLLDLGANPFVCDAKGTSLLDCLQMGEYHTRAKDGSLVLRPITRSLISLATIRAHIERAASIWRPELHHRFPLEFKQQVFALCLILQRLCNTKGYRVPRDILFIIISHLAIVSAKPKEWGTLFEEKIKQRCDEEDKRDVVISKHRHIGDEDCDFDDVEDGDEEFIDNHGGDFEYRDNGDFDEDYEMSD
jgi:hypothetical protein